MLKQPAFLFVLLIISFHNTAFASPIQFNFRDLSIEALDEQPVLNLIRDGITLSASTASGVFNRTNAGFGVNATGAGDDTDALDGNSGVSESIDFLFDTDVILNSFTVSGLGSQDIGQYLYNSLAPVEFTLTGLQSLGDVLLPIGNVLSIHYVAGNGFSLDQMTVSPFTVPEPRTLFLFCVPVMLLGIGRLYNHTIRRRPSEKDAAPA